MTYHDGELQPGTRVIVDDPYCSYTGTVEGYDRAGNICVKDDETGEVLCGSESFIA